MKFIYTGQLPIKDADLVFAGIYKSKDIIKHGDVFEVPDDNEMLIQKIKVSGVYSEFNEPKKSKPKKDKKEIEEEK